MEGWTVRLTPEHETSQATPIPDAEATMTRNVYLSIVLVALTACLAGMIHRLSAAGTGEIVVSPDMTLKQAAAKNGMPLKKILHIMSHEDRAVWELPKQKPIEAIGVDVEQVRAALEHVREDTRPTLTTAKFILWALLMAAVLLLVLNRSKVKTIRLVVMAASVVVFGIILGASPNPMESVVKGVKAINGMEAHPRVVVLSFVIFTLLSLVGSKLICSWGCQLGALQETIFNLPLVKAKHKLKVPFWLSLGTRVAVFALFLAMLCGVAFGIANFVIYHHINYFKVFELHDLAPTALFTLPILAIASLFVFRPFCQLVCPFGLYAWFLENLAFNRIRVDPEACIDCKKCVRDCPTHAMRGIRENKRDIFLPDCWSCAKCQDGCPTGAILYGSKIGKTARDRGGAVPNAGEDTDTRRTDGQRAEELPPLS